jgi:hypothetical protein
MNTQFWGPSGWQLLHTLANIYPIKPNITDKIMMRDFMSLVTDILPCKYCRASFAKYSQTLNITPYLESNILIQEWLYRMHNKVNGKLRRQGFCTIENPTLESVIAKYNHLGKHTMIRIMNNINYTTSENISNIIEYISKMGFNFLGSVIFNYQAYFANCHTNEEKGKIVSSYDKFFNMFPRIIFNFIKSYYPQNNKMLETSINYSEQQTNLVKFKIRSILHHNEPYTHLKKWFWESKLLPTYKHKQWNMNYAKYETYFNKHIVNTCNNIAVDKIKSCRKLSKKDVYTRSHTLIQNNSTHQNIKSN